jgi:integrase
LLRKRGSLKPRSFNEVERYLRKHCAPLHRLRLDQINRRTCAVLLGQIEQASGPVARNRARSALSDFFAWCLTEGLLESNPVQGTAKADENGSRERVLSHEELRKVWQSLDDGPFGAAVRLLLLTGARRNEVGKLQWSEIDFARKMIVLPPARVKNGRQFVLPLSSQTLAILQRVPHRNSSDYLFGVRGFNDWANAKARLDERAGIAPFYIHDLRRSCATGMAELGVLPHVIEQALNHVSGAKAGVAGVYNRSKMTDAVREGLQRWADAVERITA